MRETLLEYHQRLNREAKQRERDRRRTMDTLRGVIRGRELDRRIAAERSRLVDEALADVSKQWKKTREVLENCTSISQELRGTWLRRLDSIQYVSDRSNPTKLEDMASDVGGVAGDLSAIYEDLVAAAERREVSLGLVMAPSRRARTLAQLDHNPWDVTRFQPIDTLFQPLATRFSTVASDLQPIHDRILGASNVPLDLRRTWINQLEQIDKAATFLDPWGMSSTQKATALASLIKTTELDIRAVAGALSDQVRVCRYFWDL